MRVFPLLLLLAAAPVAGQTPAPACSTPGALPPELAGWASPRPLTAATTGKELGLATLPLGAAVRTSLAPTPRVAFVVTPEHQPAADTRSGLFVITVIESGTYRIALGAPAWIDVLADGKPVASIAHGHGPACTGVRKLVDFSLRPGRYVLQVSGTTEAALTLMVARHPG